VALLQAYFFYAADDIYQFAFAHDHGLGRELLTLNVFGHFSPVNRSLHWVILSWRPLDPAVGTAIAVGLLVSILLAFNWLLSELRVTVCRRAAALAILGLSAAFVSTGVFCDAAMHSLPAIAATIVVLAAHARGVRLGGVRWHIVACGALALGLLTQERVTLAAPTAALLDALVVWKAESIAQTAHHLWESRWSILSLFVVAVSEMLVIERASPLPQIHADVATAAKIIAAAYIDYVPRAILAVGTGTKLLAGTVPNTQALVVGTMVIVCALDRKNIKPLLFFASVFSLYYGLLVTSPLLVNGIEASASRVDYTAYPLPALLVAVTSLEIHIPASSRGLLSARRRRRWVAGGAVAGALLILVFLQDASYLRSSYTPVPHSFINELRGETQLWSSRRVTLLPVLVPPTIAGDWTRALGREQYFLSMLDSGYRQGDVTGPPVVIDESGHVASVSLQVTTDTPGPRGWHADEIIASGGIAFNPDGWACMDQDKASDYLEIGLPQRLSGASPEFALVEYRSSQESPFRLTAVDTGRSFTINDWPGQLHRGTHQMVVPIDAFSLTAIQLSGVTPETHLCLRRVTVVRPVHQTNAPGSCAPIDRFGASGAIEQCDRVFDRVPLPRGPVRP
jgi:hypothetical protein